MLYPATGFTKGDLADYYARVAPLILPHLAGRAVALKRFPDGVDGKPVVERRCAAHRPDWVRTVRVPTRSGRPIDYCQIADVGSLLWAADLAAVELHVPLALAAAPDRPTAMLFDLDPSEPATLAHCVRLALRLRGLLHQLGLASAVQTTGGRGLHVLVPLDPGAVTFDDTKAFARAVALTLGRDDPGVVTASTSGAAPAGTVSIDWGRNDRDRTTACVFSARGRPEPTVSWPLDWADLAGGRAPPPVRAGDDFDVRSVARHTAWLGRRQRLPAFGR